jgi:hypothetical protein
MIRTKFNVWKLVGLRLFEADVTREKDEWRAEYALDNNWRGGIFGYGPTPEEAAEDAIRLIDVDVTLSPTSQEPRAAG